MRTDLIEAGLVPASDRVALDDVGARYGAPISPAVVAEIDPGDPNDPIARQFVPGLSPVDHSAGGAWLSEQSATMRTARARGSCTATRTACC